MVSQDQDAVSEDRAFVNYVMADVYALLDFLSGRAKPSLGYLTLPTPGGQVTGDPSALAGDETSSAFVQKAMQIGKQVAKSESTIADDDVAFLIQARDLLNVRAAPATGNSIIFTLLVIDAIHSLRTDARPKNLAGPIYVFRDAWLEPAAKRLARSVKCWLRIMAFLLTITVLLSIYVAYGKLFFDTLDAVNRDNRANLTFLATEMPDTIPTTDPNRRLVDNFCGEDPLSFTKYQNCQDYYMIKERRNDVRALLRNWVILPATFEEALPFDKSYDIHSETVEQLAAARIGVIGNYILPVLYGIIGSLGFVLRQFNRNLADRLLTSRESRASHIKIMLGAMSGACIGLFFNNSAGAAQVSGVGGAAVTLSASAIAFLAGYGVEAVFKSLDALLIHVFDLNRRNRDHPGYSEGAASDRR
ncbi:hypothetical protein [Acidisphaera sp. S103]|uniref:hypothetical protein n=1 Tax=Acidisphaera sp. S103 TaxID=1747223 RepID=UPI00131BDC0E|nr:hypothetical protein [Acidisphaera sp. S103]